MDAAKLLNILDDHRKWLRNEDGGSCADLRIADLRNADLSYADLSNANLRNADLRNANLRNADLSNADLRNANLSNADLSNADLRIADLSFADLSYADLRNADLRYADLSFANLSYAIDIYLPLSCPTDGAFVGWKKARNMSNGESAIVKLMIYDDARRSSATGRKCRCDKAKVIGVYDMSGNEIDADICSMRDKSFRYVVGEIVTEPNFDENRWNECSEGIHFFITREEAERYNG